MRSYILSLQEINQTKLAIAGGKGSNLGELIKIDGIQVPAGFCITTEAYKSIVDSSSSTKELLSQLSHVKLEDRDKIRELSADIRRVIEEIIIPQEIVNEITQQLSFYDESSAYAVRSSATAEDLPSASFAGQQDTFLNVMGKKEILSYISKCWASLYTERAVMYRIQNNFDHRKVQLAVIVQQMVFPQVSGILFTADPITSKRKVLSIDAGYGLGEAMVSGLVTADNYKVQNGEIIGKKISNKQLAIYASTDGGTKEQKIDSAMQHKQALTDEQILQLELIGTKIEKHFGHPQDIEWCLANKMFYIVQSRPITTLYPIPVANDQENHVYVSVGHQQMMTNAMKPLGISLFQLTAARPMYEAAGRLFVDVAPDLASPARRRILVDVLGKSDPIIKDAMTTILERKDFIPSMPVEKQEQGPPASNKTDSHANFQTLNEYDPLIVADLIKRNQTSIEILKQNIQTKSGLNLIDFILEDIQQLKKELFEPKSFGVIMTAMNASAWINENMNKWLGEKNVADTLTQSVSNNITSEMGLELLDVADVIRPHPEVIDYLQHVKDDNFLDKLVNFNGGQETRDAILGYLNKYGMRCAGEIDITTTRWSEKPITLVPLILSNIKYLEPGASHQKFEQGRQEVLEKEQELLERLKLLPDGERKVEETKRMINLVRNYSGYREYPKYGKIRRYFIYKQALLKEAQQLVKANLIHKKEDIFYLRLEELREVIHANKLDYQVISKRKDEFVSYEKLIPPRIITSDGEIITGKHNRNNLPPKAIAGLAVSSGVIEGRARVILNMEDANLEEGDILVTTFTDPGWTALFLSIKGLVTEVGGLMTHGAVIAREYGLPAVVAVENATRLIKDGQRIRVNGTEGYVEIM